MGRIGPCLLLAVSVLMLALVSGEPGFLEDEPYCSRRPGQTCCPGRDDYCTMPILDTVCYCDIFCNRTQTDCCPDFWAFCFGAKPIIRTTPSPRPSGTCFHEGRSFAPGQNYKSNCNSCICQVSQTWYNQHSFVCSEKPCLIRQEVIDHVNRGSYGWKSSNYSSFWGLTLDDGVRYRLGTIRPTGFVSQMTPLRVLATDNIPESFDWRLKSPESVHPIMDQGNCGSSWAFSSASVASDRLAVQSNLKFRALLSPQHIISCNRDHAQQGCNGGHVDRAWWYIWKVGVVEDKCYPYRSGTTMQVGNCKIPRSAIRPGATVKCPPGTSATTSMVYQSSPSYRIPPHEKEIMKEVMDNGPVQAILEVKEDFYMYKTGVYRYSMPASSMAPNHMPTGFHSVKIVGWGDEEIDGHRIKYWICANSWGPQWGENGYFRIVRGTNECEIESFIVGVWAHVDGKAVSPNLRRTHRKRHAEKHRSHAQQTGRE